MLKNSWKITMPIVLVVVIGLSIGGYGIMNKTDFNYRLFAELKNVFKVGMEFDNCQVK
jgi:hypothetical protein